MYCSKCGVQVVDTEIACPQCGQSLRSTNLPASTPNQPQIIVVKSGKSAGIAAVLSFFWCGLGQIYNGQIGKGIAMLVVYGISVALIFVLIGIVTTPILWIVGMVDAYRTAERLNREAGLG